MSIPILRIKDKNGRISIIPAIKGEKGDKGADGTVSFDELSDEQKASLKGEKGDTGAVPDMSEWIKQDYDPESDLAASCIAVAAALADKFQYGTEDPPEDAPEGTIYIQLEE